MQSVAVSQSISSRIMAIEMFLSIVRKVACMIANFFSIKTDELNSIVMRNNCRAFVEVIGWLFKISKEWPIIRGSRASTVLKVYIIQDMNQIYTIMQEHHTKHWHILPSSIKLSFEEKYEKG